MKEAVSATKVITTTACPDVLTVEAMLARNLREGSA